MILRRVVVRHFRGIREARFEGLSDRLNLFYGPNESGKSTLVEAIHFGLFERSAGEARTKRDIRTWNGADAPEVEVDFEDEDAQLWRIHKRFLVQPSTVLEGRHVVLRGEDAEKRLREMLGTRRGSARGTDDADLGIWPLLWVRQGRSGEPVKNDTHPDARARISATLAAQTGEIVAGEAGERIRAQARAWYEEHFTPTGRPNAAHERVQAAAREAEEHAAALRAAWEAGRARVDALTQAERTLATLEPRLAERRARALDAQARAARARQSAQAVERTRADLDLADARAQQAEAALREREGLARDHADALAAEATTRAQVEAAEQAWAAAEAERAAVLEAVERARTEARLAARAADAVGRSAERGLLVEQEATLRQRLAHVEALQARLRELQSAIDGAPLSAADLGRIEDAERERQRLADRAEDAAVRLTVTALAGGTVDGASVAAGVRQPRVLAGPTTLRLDDRWLVEVDPGPATGAGGALAEATAAVRTLLDAAGVPDVAAARALVAERRAHEVDKAGVVQQLGLVGAEGTAPLHRDLTRVTRRLAELPDDAGLPDPARAAAAREAADRALLDAEVQVRANDATWSRAREALGEARAAQRAAEAERGRVDARLAVAVALQAARDAAEAAREERARAAVAFAAAQQLWREAGGAEAEAEERQEAEALQGLERRQTGQREEVVALRAEVRALEAEGLYDQLGAAEALAVEARVEADALARRAAARRALHEAVEAAWRRMRDRFVDPVRRAVEAEVPLLFPGSRLLVDEQGDVVGLVTRGQEERFEQLSGGAREQLGVLVRLGIARVLAGERRLPVLLDDALVNSDADRRARMVEVLRRMSEHLQVLLFTCHDEDFDRLAASWEAEVRGRPRRTG